MPDNDLQTTGNDREHDRRDNLTPGNRFLGRVVACSGSRATIAATAEAGGTDLTELWSVGRLISISVGRNRVVALAYAMNTGEHSWGEGQDNYFKIETELLGEVRVEDDGREEFSTGISQYPYLGAIAHRIRAADLMRIYDAGSGTTAVIGKLTQDESIDAAIHIPSMLSRHFAIVGSTGVGKSTAVSLLLHKAIEADPKLRVLILDPHNEFAAAFPKHSVVIDTDTLDLPFWLMRLEEFAEVVFRGRTPVPEELDMLRDIMPEAKRAFRGSDSSLVRRQTEKSSITADTPVPYRMADLLALIDERIGRLEGRAEKPFLRSLKMRIIAAINDPRYHFMFSNNTISDTIMETVAQIFRIPGDNRPICTFQLSGIPSEVVNSVASVLCRMAFEIGLWSDGAIHMLVVCEEAHRYVPADPNLGFIPTRQAIARIAKEGRKYGVSLGIITQRPGELDQTILSQCSTLFAMRLANESDQEIIRSAIPNSSISTTSFISSIGNGEAIAFGEAISVPMRMRFSRVEQHLLPKANGANVKQSDEDPDSVDLRKIVTRMRAVSGGPDISSFQQSYNAAQSDMLFDDEEPPEDSLYPAPISAPPLAPSESYRPDMLPRSYTPREPAPAAPPSTSIDSRLEALRREMRRDETASQRPAFSPDSAAGPRREPGRSLRESILKKPLSSLYDKD
ncbi:ATP-binding protein [Rhizobium sp. P32RR-XVIII]|uniref:ATP-binding protein n=1 Tax=Rhizobium sp. P32RR-XVIII TaxID=2726738 RepID=UPI001456F821|nr:ATP-binding protein [Rhizobium sp. P32RR-XVIII]NLS04772.1 ATP-binding protein [Rhizobium sp. P32RR-XVIII]